MANKKVSEFPTVASIETNDFLTSIRPGDPSGTKNKKITPQQVSNDTESRILPFKFISDWNAATNIPALVSSVGTRGHYYRVSANGSTTLDTISRWFVDDLVWFDGTVWRKATTNDLSDFLNTIFRVSDSADNTKKIAFDASLITTGNVRTLSSPDNSGILALLNQIKASESLNDSNVVGTKVSDALNELLEQIKPVLAPVLDFIDFTTSEPGAPTIGDRYINTVTGNSSVTTQAMTSTYIYEWNGASWTETVPVAGDRIFDAASSDYFIYSGIAWIADHETLNQLQIYYISKAGSDSNSGLNENDPVLTIPQAITLATAQTPSTSNRYMLHIIDGDVYQLTASANLPSWVYLYAPSATLDGDASGNLVLADNSGALFGNVIRSGGGFSVHKTVGSGDAYFTVLNNVDVGAYGWLNLANGNLHIKFNRAVTTGATTSNLIQVSNGTLYLDGNYLNNSSAIVAKTLDIHGTGILRANVDSINSGDDWLNLADTAQAYVESLSVTGNLTISSTGHYNLRVPTLDLSSQGKTVQTASGDYTITINGANNKHKINGYTLGSQAILGKGDVDGFVVKYSSTTAVSITAGAIEANGKHYRLTSDTTFTLTGLASGFDFHYIYIDDSASTEPTPVFFHSTLEPTWSDAKNGWYNVIDDRCIGVIISKDATAEIVYFSTRISGSKHIIYHIGESDILQMASDMDPISAWQTPDDNDGSAVTPVTAEAAYIKLRAGDVGSICSARAASLEMAAVNTSTLDGDIDYSGYERLRDDGWVNLGASRNIKIAGTNDDDNILSCWCIGFAISR